MKSASNYQIFPLENDVIFEDFVCDIFNHCEKTTSFDLYGRKGQNQSGIDIISFEKKTVVQCKLKILDRPDGTIKKELTKDLNDEIERFLNFNKKHRNDFNKFILASTFKNDKDLTDECIKLSQSHNIIIEYWSWKRLIKNINNKLFNKYGDSFSASSEKYFRNNFQINSKIKVDKSMPLLNQVYEFLKLRFREIKVLHSDVFLYESPFQENEKYSHKNIFNLKHYNQEFYDLFENLVFKDKKLINNFNGNCNDYEMYDFITEKFTENNIFNIVSNEYRPTKSIINIKNNEDDFLDNFNKYKFITVLKNLTKLSNKIALDEILRMGFFYYKIGDLIKSKDMFLAAKKIAEKENKKIIALIIQHNLFHLGKFIKGRYWRLNNKIKIVEELTSILLNNIEVDNIDEPIKEFIVSRDFFNRAEVSIQSNTQKVEKNYYSYIRGGSSSSNYEYELDYEYGTLNSFLSKNYIVYDQYSDYTRVINNIFNSLLASYSIKKGNNRITNISDYFLVNFIEYGKIKDFEKYLSRYQIFEIEYVKSEDVDYNFVNLFTTFTENIGLELDELLKNKEENFVEYFQNLCNNRFNNFVFFAGIITLKNEEVKIITENILKTLVNKNVSQRNSIENVIDYFIRKRKQIEEKQLIKLIFYSLKNTEYYYSNSLVSLFNFLKREKTTLTFTKTQFKTVTKHFYAKSNKKDEVKFDYDLAIDIYGILPPEHKIIIKENILKKLFNPFDKQLYFLAVAYDIIDYNFEESFAKYIDSIDMKNEKPNNRSAFIDREHNFIRYQVLDSFFNIAFKVDLNLSDDKFHKFKGYSDYYDWLLDIDNFDYTKFDPYWVDEYGSIYYYQKMRKHKIVEVEVRKHLSKANDNRLKEIFYNIFCMD